MNSYLCTLDNIAVSDVPINWNNLGVRSRLPVPVSLIVNYAENSYLYRFDILGIYHVWNRSLMPMKIKIMGK